MILGGVLRINRGPGATEELAASIQRVLPELEAAGDQLALYIAYSGLADVTSLRGEMDAALAAYDRAFECAQRAGQVPTEGIGTLAAYRYFGSTTASDLLQWLDENEPRAARDQFLRAYRAMAVAMLGRLDEARAILDKARAGQSERGGGALLANLLVFESVDLELLAGDPGAAAKHGAEGFRLHEEMGNQDFLAPAAGNLARALYELDRFDEADAWAGRSAELGTSDDAMKEMAWRQVRAKVLARRGEHTEAERLAREAVAIGARTDSLIGQGDANADLAEVLSLAGKPDEAAAALRQALDRYERKEHLVLAQQVRDRLESLDPSR
jgi:tetratricopeptide (TPR) repeat protein